MGLKFECQLGACCSDPVRQPQADTLSRCNVCSAALEFRSDFLHCQHYYAVLARLHTQRCHADCRQWSGVNGVSFFAPQIFAGVNALGSGNEGSLIAAVIVNGVQLIATIITVCIVDKVGRRTLLISGSMLGFLSEIAVAIVFAVTAGKNAINLPYGASIAAIVLVSSKQLSSLGFMQEATA